MSATTWYAPGSGMLVRSGRHLLLLDITPDQGFIDACWETARAGVDVPARWLRLAGEHHPGAPLVLFDLGSQQQDARGGAEVEHTEDGCLLRLPSASQGWASRERPGRGFLLPVDGGILAASAVEIRLPRTGQAALIDGIPATLLQAMAEEPTAEPAQGYRESVGGGVGRSAGGGDPRPGDADHDGRTTHLDTTDPAEPAAGPARVAQRPPSGAATGNTVLAVLCPRGHVTSALVPTCRLCGAEVAEQQPNRIARPQLGVLRLPDGTGVPLDRGVVFGRKPTSAAPLDSAYPHLVTLPLDNAYLSRAHLTIELDGWLVVARDLGSRGGTWWQVPGRAPERMRPGEPYLLEPGHTVNLAESYPVVYEVTS